MILTKDLTLNMQMIGYIKVLPDELEKVVNKP